MQRAVLALSFCHLGIAARIQRQRKDKSANVSTFGVGKGSFHLRVQESADGCQILDAEWGQLHRKAVERVFEKEQWVWTEEEGAEQDHSDEKLIDFWGPSEAAVRDRAQKVCGGRLAAMPPHMSAIPEGTDVRCLVCSGDSSNRIDVVFMGDGYTKADTQRFWDDMQRLTDEMFTDVTFSSYLPVFNIWGIHPPSQESGIGYNSRSKDTTFGLYKQGTQHRGVFPSLSGRSNAREICRLAGGCDYPSIIGNDEFYGGLGGEFVIGTRSKTTGTLVLRHEMGHNFVDVGEEYDGGQVYSGVNAESSGWGTPSSVKWSHWLTEPNKPLREERMTLPLLEYPWHDLAAGPRSFNFTSDGTYARWKLSFTVSGCPEEGSLKVFLDGQPLTWAPRQMAGSERPDGTSVDRLFYHFEDASAGFTAGRHTLSFESGFAPPAGGPIRQLCSLNIHEFGNDAEFHNEPGYIGLYPSWSISNSKYYRPTNDMCLMRTMESRYFCPICKEGMWYQFLARMSLIDAVEVTGDQENFNVELKAVPLAQFRERPVPGLTESYSVVWSKDGQEQPQLADRYSFGGTAAELRGMWAVTLTLTSSEVRADPNGLLSDRKTFAVGVTGSCPWHGCVFGCGGDDCIWCERCQ